MVRLGLADVDGNGQERTGRDRQHRWGSDLQGIKGNADKAGTGEVRCGGDWQSRQIKVRFGGLGEAV